MSRSTWVAVTVGFGSLAMVAVAPSTMAAIHGNHGGVDRHPVQSAPVSSHSNSSTVVALSKVGGHGGGDHGPGSNDGKGGGGRSGDGKSGGFSNQGSGHGPGNTSGGHVDPDGHWDPWPSQNGGGHTGNGGGNGNGHGGDNGHGDGHDGHCSYPPSHSPQESLSAHQHGNQVVLHGAASYNGCGHGHHEVALYRSTDGHHGWTLVTTTTADDKGNHVFTVPTGHHHAYYRAVVAGDNDYLPACSGVVEA